MAYTLNYTLINNGTAYEVSGYTGELVNVVIPKEYNALSVTSIGNYAFSECSSLKSIVIPDSVTSIGSYAFEYCSSLTSVIIPDSVTSISAGAFNNCSSLTSVVIGDSVTSIGDYAFNGCYKLLEVVNKSTHITVTKGSSSNGYVGYYALAVYNSDSGITESQLTNDNGYMIYTDGNEKILVGYNGTETDLILPSYVTKINNYAFSDCYSLTSVVIPDSVTSIGDKAFYRCGSLTSVVIPDSVTSIGSSAFESCSLTSMVIPDSVTSIGEHVFLWCSSLTSVVIPDSVTSIGYEAFAYCSSLTSVVIPDSVTSIGSYAFERCKSLTSVTLIAKTPPSIYSDAFYNISASAKFYCKSNALQSYKIATNWNTYASQFVADDMRIYFIMSAKAQKKYFASKEDLLKVETNLENGEGSGSLQQTGYTLDGVHKDFRHYAAAYGIAPSLGVDIETVMSTYTYDQLLGMIAQANFGGNTTLAEQHLYGMIDQVLTDQDLEFLPNEVNGPASTTVGVGNKVWSPISFISGYNNIVGRKGNPLGAIGSAVFGKDLINNGSYSFVSGESLINNGSHSFIGGRKSSIKISGFEDPVDKENCSKMFDALVSQDLLTSYDENTEWTWDGNHSGSSRNFVFNGYISEDASRLNTVFGSSVTTGYGTTTFGDQNVNSGQYNFIHGLSNFVISNPGDPLDTPATKAVGFHNFIYGARNTIFSKDGWACLFNHVIGQNNQIFNSNYSNVSGDSNILGRELGINQGNVHIQGHENNVNGISISVLGEKNTVKITDGKGLLLNGDSNTVGETIYYSTVIGDNNLVRNEKYATAIGSHLQLVEGKDHTQHRTALGKYNIDNKDAMFMIGNGTGDAIYQRSNAFEVYKNGSVRGGKLTSTSDDEYTLATKSYVDSKIESGSGTSVKLYKHTYRIYYTPQAYANYICYRTTEESLGYNLYSELCNGSSTNTIGGSAVMSGNDLSVGSIGPVIVQAMTSQVGMLMFYYRGTTAENTGSVSFYLINEPVPFTEFDSTATQVKGNVYYQVEEV